MKILIVGNGGREHALAWKLAQSPKAKRLFVAPGNGGTATTPKTQNLAIAATNIPELLAFARSQKIDLCVVGPEAPLALGICDQFKAAAIPCIGPTQAAAQLESSKIFCKDFLQQHQIPTAAYAHFDTATEALSYLEQRPGPWVIKADGLAAGKGVLICHSLPEAQAGIHSLLTEAKFGEASQRIIIEDFLIGMEASFICLVHNNTIVPLATSQDHKARDAGDTGPNTGGMGAYSPAPISEDLENAILTHIIVPTLAGMQAAGTPYSGFLYAGLMISPEGCPYVLEFNCRLGDPETQPILCRLRSDLLEVFIAYAENRLDSITLDWDPRPALGVVMTAGGYPEAYAKDQVIQGLDSIDPQEAHVFHAGTQQEPSGAITTQGGRVLCVCALGSNLADAQKKAYTHCKKIHWPDCYYRHDIGHRAL